MLDELDQLLKEALSHEQQTQTIAKARKTAVTARPGSQEFEEANHYVKQWEKENLWEFRFNEVFVSRDICTCGHVHETVAGLFAVYGHKHHSDRLDKRACKPHELPPGQQRTFVHETAVGICINCYQEKGFPDAKA